MGGGGGGEVSAEDWLRRALASATAFDDDTLLEGVAVYARDATDQAVADYLQSFIADADQASKIVSEYLARRRKQPEPKASVESPAAASGANNNQYGKAYFKPAAEDVAYVQGKTKAIDIEQRELKLQRRDRKKEREREQKEAARIRLNKPHVDPGRKPCSCMAMRHRLVSNCLACGKIVCEQEGEGPCMFCGAMVLRDYSGVAIPDKGVDPQAGASQQPVAALDQEAQQKSEEATKFKDRLVEYDRTAAARTTVIDDQSDYFLIDGNAWLSEEEKAQLRKQIKEKEDREQAQRRRVKVTIDLIGRKVVAAEPSDDETEPPPIEHSQAAAPRQPEQQTGPVGVNPLLRGPAPIFMPAKVQPAAKSATTAVKANVRHRPRVQDDNPYNIDAVRPDPVVGSEV
eukprot:jgi/Chlat1/5209/Chrsp33S05047